MNNNKITIKNISKRFGDFWALKDFNAIIFPNKITAIVGPNGAGKTTLFNIISGLIKPNTGKVVLSNLDITAYPPYMIANIGIGRLFQDLRIYSKLTVMENVISSLISKNDNSVLGGIKFTLRRNPYKNLKEEAYKWLSFVGLSEQANKLAEELSYGQQKLLALARLFAADFQILLLDEPASGLAPKMVEKVLKLIREMSEKHNKTIALIEHNMVVVKEISYWIHFLNEGKLAFTGRTDHILGHTKVREIYMGF